MQVLEDRLALTHHCTPQCDHCRVIRGAPSLSTSEMQLGIAMVALNQLSPCKGNVAF